MARLVFLGRLADLAGAAERDLATPAPLDWAGLTTALGPLLAAAVADDKVRVAINGELRADKAALMLGSEDELVFLPPVSGG